MSGLLACPSNVKDGNDMCRSWIRRYITRNSYVNDALRVSVNSLTKHLSTSKGLDKKSIIFFLLTGVFRLTIFE